MIASGSLFTDFQSGSNKSERIEDLLVRRSLRIERIVSTGQASPAEFWYDQEQSEWVAVLQGKAVLLIEGEETPRTMMPGDWLLLPPHVRHRVLWTEANPCTVWLAVHYQEKYWQDQQSPGNDLHWDNTEE